jgi:hypothetical protein
MSICSTTTWSLEMSTVNYSTNIQPLRGWDAPTHIIPAVDYLLLICIKRINIQHKKGLRRSPIFVEQLERRDSSTT